MNRKAGYEDAVDEFCRMTWLLEARVCGKDRRGALLGRCAADFFRSEIRKNIYSSDRKCDDKKDNDYNHRCRIAHEIHLPSFQTLYRRICSSIALPTSPKSDDAKTSALTSAEIDIASL